MSSPVPVPPAAAWCDALQHAAAQYRWLLGQLPDAKRYPRTWEHGKRVLVRPADWTSGFFPGALWLLAGLTRDATWRTSAATYTGGLEGMKANRRTHDIGFMLYCSFGQGYRLTRDPHYRAVLLAGAESLVTRFNPVVGCIKSWDTRAEWPFPVIIDNMMNLELLLWATQESGDPRFREIAIRHADVTLANHFRPDGSSYHVVDYEPATGIARRRQTHQGAADESAWARGQAWGLYGYTFMYRETRRPAYLAQARKIAAFLLGHPRLPEDKVPYWDFDAPQLERAPRDASAAAIICSALFELSLLVADEDRRQYVQFASVQLASLCSPAYRAEVGSNGGFILMHSTGSLPRGSEIDVPLNYADYYFLEALQRAAIAVDRRS
ncbi:glycoside hydrolase family 88 protein [Opitutus sp. ER46]|uniref:glycoside hydrolase family 88 protein n=1 Tax=Opitutus sp. ER46 TaxID=2161864 RepID=UPI000D315B3F|nr:glycoside hydrolase family 88 protein [Opitutus sp. ER46]PTX95842.1 glucuronyl hydrolase [Opitutus sp. ER46]